MLGRPYVKLQDCVATGDRFVFRANWRCKTGSTTSSIGNLWAPFGSQTIAVDFRWIGIESFTLTRFGNFSRRRRFSFPESMISIARD